VVGLGAGASGIPARADHRAISSEEIVLDDANVSADSACCTVDSKVDADAATATAGAAPCAVVETGTVGGWGLGLGDETGKGSSNFGVGAGMADWDMAIPVPPAIARGDADGGAEVDNDADACGGKLDDRLALTPGELTPTAARAAASFHPPPNPLALVAVADRDGGPGRL
jgi:hypothetical protein